jgi:hypothetical protein
MRTDLRSSTDDENDGGAEQTEGRENSQREAPPAGADTFIAAANGLDIVRREFLGHGGLPDVIENVTLLAEISACAHNRGPYIKVDVVNKAEQATPDKTDGETPGQTHKRARPRDVVPVEELRQQTQWYGLGPNDDMEDGQQEHKATARHPEGDAQRALLNAWEYLFQGDICAAALRLHVKSIFRESLTWVIG